MRYFHLANAALYPERRTNLTKTETLWLQTPPEKSESKVVCRGMTEPEHSREGKNEAKPLKGNEVGATIEATKISNKFGRGVRSRGRKKNQGTQSPRR